MLKAANVELAGPITQVGNALVTAVVSLVGTFWLQGALRVSPLEQLEFVRRLAQGELPMTQRAQRIVRASLVRERTSGYTLYAKGGGSGSAKSAVQWWTGWVERKGRPAAYFATNATSSAKLGSGELFALSRALLVESRALPSESPPS